MAHIWVQWLSLNAKKADYLFIGNNIYWFCKQSFKQRELQGIYTHQYGSNIGYSNLYEILNIKGEWIKWFKKFV